MERKSPIKPNTTLYTRVRTLSTPLKKSKFVLKNTMTAKIIVFLWVVYSFQFIFSQATGVSILENLRLYDNPSILWIIVGMFFHASIVHILVNSATLMHFGMIAEEDFDSKRFLVMFIIFGLITVFFQYLGAIISIKTSYILFSGGSTSVFVGSSGAICAIIGLSSVKRPQSKVHPILIPSLSVNILYGILIFIVFSVLCVAFLGIFSLGLAHIAHISGILIGTGYGIERYGAWRIKHLRYDLLR